MNDHKFIRELESELRALPAQIREDVLNDYRAHVAEARERGKSDETIADSLGDARSIARTILADYHVSQLTKPADDQKFSTNIYHMVRATIMLLSILLFNFFFVLWPVLVLAIVLASAWFLAGVVVVVAPIIATAILIGGFISTFAIGLPAVLALFFYSLAFAGAGVLCCFLLATVSRYFIVGLMKYIKLNARVIHVA